MSHIDPEIISILINNEADINATTERLETPIFLACQCNNVKAVELLLATRKCDISYPNDLGQEPIFIAYKNDNKHILRLFKEYKKEN
jgi:ankyrin repeat protein